MRQKTCYNKIYLFYQQTFNIRRVFFFFFKLEATNGTSPSFCIYIMLIYFQLQWRIQFQHLQEGLVWEVLNKSENDVLSTYLGWINKQTLPTADLIGLYKLIPVLLFPWLAWMGGWSDGWWTEWLVWLGDIWLVLDMSWWLFWQVVELTSNN